MASPDRPRVTGNVAFDKSNLVEEAIEYKDATKEKADAEATGIKIESCRKEADGTANQRRAVRENPPVNKAMIMTESTASEKR